MADWEKHLDMLPFHMREGMKTYIKMGLPPGGFMTAVLANDLKGAFLKADEINQRHMKEWASYLYWYAPSGAQGSYVKVQEWIKHSGLAGMWRQEQGGSPTPPDTDSEKDNA